jgi:hypothetical protein
MNIPYQYLVTFVITAVTMWILLSSTFSILPISDVGCDNYQYVRGMFTSEGVAIGCEWNGTAWHFNETLVNLTFREAKEYLI